jgi:hypothetical protein
MSSTEDPVAMAVAPALLLTASVLAHILFNQSSQKKETESTATVFLKLPDINPCDDPPPGLGLGEEDPVVHHYLKASLQDPSWSEIPTKVDDKDVGTPDEWIHRHPDLVRLTGRHPFNCEPPLRKLVDKGYITPHNLHYVRSHGAPPKAKFAEHRIHIGGSVPNKIVLTMADILTLPRRSLPVTLVCCGNVS